MSESSRQQNKGLMMSRRAAHGWVERRVSCLAVHRVVPARAPWSETGASWEIEPASEKQPSETEKAKRIANRRT